MLNALTIDLEDWYQGLTSTSRQVERWPDFEDRVVDSTLRLLAILERAQVTATFFVLGYVATQFPELVRHVADAGHEIGLHGGIYHHQVSRMRPEQFRAEVCQGREAVERASRREVRGYRAPMFSIDRSAQWALELLHDLGFHYDSSVFPTQNMLYGFPGAPRFPYRPLDSAFVEYPLSTVRILGMNLPMAGGFYLRAMPYPIFKQGLRRIHREGQPAVIYLHPWELDPDQPRPSPTPRERFTHYYNLRRMEGKLASLLADFSFAPLAEIDVNVQRREATE